MGRVPFSSGAVWGAGGVVTRRPAIVIDNSSHYV